MGEVVAPDHPDVQGGHGAIDPRCRWIHAKVYSKIWQCNFRSSLAQEVKVDERIQGDGRGNYCRSLISLDFYPVLNTGVRGTARPKDSQSGANRGGGCMGTVLHRAESGTCPVAPLALCWHTGDGDGETLVGQWMCQLIQLLVFPTSASMVVHGSSTWFNTKIL